MEVVVGKILGAPLGAEVCDYNRRRGKVCVFIHRAFVVLDKLWLLNDEGRQLRAAVSVLSFVSPKGLNDSQSSKSSTINTVRW